MNKIKLSLAVAVVLLVVVGLYYALKPGKDSCEYVTELKYSDAAVMGNILTPEVTYDWKPNHYRCNKPKKGELTAYQLGQNPEIYVRVVAAAAGDVISIMEDTNKRGYNLIVNGLRYGNPGGPFWFGVPGLRPTIALYLGADGTRTLGEGEIVVMGTGAPGFNDSGLFGIMSVKSMQGIVILPSEGQKELDSILVWEDMKTGSSESTTGASGQIGDPAFTSTTTTKSTSTTRASTQQRQRPRNQQPNR